eukprot:gene14356-15853_t
MDKIGNFMTFLVLGIILVVASFCFLRFVCLIVSRRLRRKYGINLSIESFGILTANDIQIEKAKDFRVKIQQISLVSGFLHNKFKKPLNIVFGPISVELLEKTDFRKDELSQGTRARSNMDPESNKQSTSIILRSILYILQHIGFEAPKILLTASFGDLKLVSSSSLSGSIDFKYTEGSPR